MPLAQHVLSRNSTGKERDSLTGADGLDYFGARYYGSNMGRFLTPDWAAAPTAVPYAIFDDPQTLNLYTYVRNNPATRFDADGHCFLGRWGKDCKPPSPPTADPAKTRSLNSSVSPVNRNFRLAVTKDSGGSSADLKKTQLEGREMTYQLQTAKGDKIVAKNVVITEHLSQPMAGGKYTTSDDGTRWNEAPRPGEFQDAIGPGGSQDNTGVQTGTRYFTVRMNGELLGVIPIADRNGTHVVDTISIDYAARTTSMNGTYESTAIPQ